MKILATLHQVLWFQALKSACIEKPILSFTDPSQAISATLNHSAWKGWYLHSRQICSIRVASITASGNAIGFLTIWIIDYSVGILYQWYESTTVTSLGTVADPHEGNHDAMPPPLPPQRERKGICRSLPNDVRLKRKLTIFGKKKLNLNDCLNPIHNWGKWRTLMIWNHEASCSLLLPGVFRGFTDHRFWHKLRVAVFTKS